MVRHVHERVHGAKVQACMRTSVHAWWPNHISVCGGNMHRDYMTMRTAAYMPGRTYPQAWRMNARRVLRSGQCGIHIADYSMAVGNTLKGIRHSVCRPVALHLAHSGGWQDYTRLLGNYRCKHLMCVMRAAFYGHLRPRLAGKLLRLEVMALMASSTSGGMRLIPPMSPVAMPGCDLCPARAATSSPVLLSFPTPGRAAAPGSGPAANPLRSIGPVPGRPRIRRRPTRDPQKYSCYRQSREAHCGACIEYACSFLPLGNADHDRPHELAMP